MQWGGLTAPHGASRGFDRELGGEKNQPCLSVDLGHAVELMAVKFLFGLLTPCLDLADLNILKRKAPGFSLELIVAFAYQPQYLAIELRIKTQVRLIGY